MRPLPPALAEIQNRARTSKSASFQFSPDDHGLPCDSPWFDEDVRAARGLAAAMFLCTAFVIAICLVAFALHRIGALL